MDKTPEEIEELLKEFEGSWREVGGHSVEPSHVKKSKKVLETLRGMLIQQMEKDQGLKAALLERLQREKHGGGQ